MWCVGGVMIIVSEECVDCVRCNEDHGYCVNCVGLFRQPGVVRRIRDADGSGFLTELMVYVGFVGVGRCFGLWGVSIAVDKGVGWSVAASGFSLVVLRLDMQVSELDVFICLHVWCFIGIVMCGHGKGDINIVRGCDFNLVMS